MAGKTRPVKSDLLEGDILTHGFYRFGAFAPKGIFTGGVVRAFINGKTGREVDGLRPGLTYTVELEQFGPPSPFEIDPLALLLSGELASC